MRAREIQRQAERDALNEYRLINPSDRSSFPPPFDLVLLLTDQEKVFPGWYIGAREWGGRQYKEGMVIKAWKRKNGLY